MEGSPSFNPEEGDEESINDGTNLEAEEFLGSLTEEIIGIEDVSEDELEWDEIVQETRSRLLTLGVKGSDNLREEDIEKLGPEIFLDQNQYSLEDLFFAVLDDELGEDYPVNFQDLVQASESIDIRKLQEDLSKQSTKILAEAGIDQLEMLEWGLMGTPRQKRAMRHMARLLTHPIMKRQLTGIKERAEIYGPFKFKQIALIVPTWLENKKNNLVNQEHMKVGWPMRRQKAYALDRVRIERWIAVSDIVFKADLDDGEYDRKE